MPKAANLVSSGFSHTVVGSFCPAADSGDQLSLWSNHEGAFKPLLVGDVAAVEELLSQATAESYTSPEEVLRVLHSAASSLGGASLSLAGIDRFTQLNARFKDAADKPGMVEVSEVLAGLAVGMLKSIAVAGRNTQLGPTGELNQMGSCYGIVCSLGPGQALNEAGAAITDLLEQAGMARSAQSVVDTAFAGLLRHRLSHRNCSYATAQVFVGVVSAECGLDPRAVLKHLARRATRLNLFPFVQEGFNFDLL